MRLYWFYNIIRELLWQEKSLADCSLTGPQGDAASFGLSIFRPEISGRKKPALTPRHPLVALR